VVKDTQKLLQILKEGTPEEKDKTAEFACKIRSENVAIGVVPFLKDKDPLVRQLSVIIISVTGYDKAKGLLYNLKKNDEAAQVRMAADIGLRFFGNITYQKMKQELKHCFAGKSQEEKKKETVYHSNKIEKEKEVDMEEKVNKDKIARQKPEPVEPTGLDKIVERKAEKKQNYVTFCFKLSRNVLTQFKRAAVLVPVITVMILVVSFIGYRLFYKSPEQKETDNIDRSPVKISELLMKREEDIKRFKEINSFTANSAEQLPVTIAVSTIYEDNYGLLVNEFYSNAGVNGHGKNTVLAFWRKHNLPDIKSQTDKELFLKNTGEGKLIFPNYKAMHLEYDLSEGSVAFENIFTPNENVEISITVSKVEVK